MCLPAVQRTLRNECAAFMFCHSQAGALARFFLQRQMRQQRSFSDAQSRDSVVSSSIVPFDSAINLLYRPYKVHLCLSKLSMRSRKNMRWTTFCVRSLRSACWQRRRTVIRCMHQGESENSNEKSLPYRSCRDRCKFSANVFRPCAGTGRCRRRSAHQYCKWIVSLRIAN